MTYSWDGEEGSERASLHRGKGPLYFRPSTTHVRSPDAQRPGSDRRRRLSGEPAGGAGILLVCALRPHRDLCPELPGPVAHLHPVHADQGGDGVQRSPTCAAGDDVVRHLLYAARRALRAPRRSGVADEAYRRRARGVEPLFGADRLRAWLLADLPLPGDGRRRRGDSRTRGAVAPQRLLSSPDARDGAGGLFVGHRRRRWSRVLPRRLDRAELWLAMGVLPAGLPGTDPRRHGDLRARAAAWPYGGRGGPLWPRGLEDPVPLRAAALSVSGLCAVRAGVQQSRHLGAVVLHPRPRHEPRARRCRGGNPVDRGRRAGHGLRRLSGGPVPPVGEGRADGVLRLGRARFDSALARPAV